jgi:betaine-aldehyde dehydrogenase
MGPVITCAARDRITGLIERGQGEGAKLVVDGRKPAVAGHPDGFYVGATLFDAVTPQMSIYREEIFGPVLCVLRWRDEDALWRDVNAVEYGLSCSIWTRDLATAHRAAGRAEAGFVWVNHTGAHFIGAPFGGYKQSGHGREESFDELLSYTQVKNIHIAL